MFDIGWTEILVIVGVAIIVVGPKDIPKMLRTIGNYMRKAKTLMRDVRRQVEEVADISELKELKAQADSLKNFDMDAATTPSTTDLQATHDPEPAQSEPSALDSAAAQVKTAKVAEPAAEKPAKTTKAKTATKPKPKAKPRAKASSTAASKAKAKPKPRAKAKTTTKPKPTVKIAAQKTS